MQNNKYATVVIGGGAAGLTASITSASMGAKTLLIEKEERLGGDCLHYGCVPSKSLIKSAYAYKVIRNSQKYGLPKVDIPAVDFKSVKNRIRNIIATIQVHDSPEFFKERYNIDTKFGRARFIDPNTIELNGEKIAAKRFILATGSSPRIPSLPGLSKVPYITNIDVFSLEKLPKSLIVLGGGPIGIEMAQAFARLGSKVTVIQAGPQILPKEDGDVARFMENILKEDGVNILTDTKALEVQKEGDSIKLKVEKNDSADFVVGELLLVAAGRVPNAGGLDLKKAGVHCEPNGIKVNDRLRTTAKNIYAAGDCSGGYLFTHVAEYEARIAALNANLPLALFKADYSKVPWCTYLDPEVASIGYNETRAGQAGTDYKVYTSKFTDVDRALAEGETEGFIKILVGKKGAVIGVQIVGFHAGELIHEWVAAINGKVSISKIAQSIHIYPTLAQINKKVSGSYLAAKILDNPALKVVKSIFGSKKKS